MILYHYTTLEALALILNSKSIRFSKLTTVDDPYEYGYIQGNTNPAQYLFVSCWSASSIESIPQWKMYSNKGHGVRIGMDENMFAVVNDHGQLKLYPDSYFNGKNYFIMPILSMDKFISSVEYIDDPYSAFSKIFVDLNGSSAIDFKNCGYYKSADWSFQKEKRYRLTIFPKYKDSFSVPENFLVDGMLLDFFSIDIPIIENVFQHMEITLGPYMTKAEECLANSIINKYINSPIIKKSVFS